MAENNLVHLARQIFQGVHIVEEVYHLPTFLDEGGIGEEDFWCIKNWNLGVWIVWDDSSGDRPPKNVDGRRRRPRALDKGVAATKGMQDYN